MNHIVNSNGKVEISETELNDLLKDQMKLEALEQTGVDNWDWYDEAMKLFREWNET